MIEVPTIGNAPDGAGKIRRLVRPERVPVLRKIRITLTDCEARQVDRALAKHESDLEGMIAGEVAWELRMVWEDELRSAQSVVRKIGPLFSKIRRDRANISDERTPTERQRSNHDER